MNVISRYRKGEAPMRRFLVHTGSFLSLMLFALPVNAERDWTANELSILFPLPQVSDLKNAVRIDEIIPPEKLGRAPRVGLQVPPTGNFFFPAAEAKFIAATELESTYLIAVRIDPCFRDQFVDACRHQIRLVWQPLGPRASQLIALDGAGHSFHDLDEKTFTSLLGRLRELNFAYSSAFRRNSALQVHPVLAKAGYNSDYFRELRAILIDTVQRSFLSRFAFMEIHGFGEFWEFISTDFLRDGSVQHVKIPGFDNPRNLDRIVVSNEFQDPEETIRQAKKGRDFDVSKLIELREKIIGRFAFRGSLGFISDPEPGTKEFEWAKEVRSSAIGRFLIDSEQFPERDFPKLTREIRMVEDPKKHLPGTVDCASCHAAEPIQAFRRGDVAGAKSFHAFGYFESQVSVSQRVKNETDEVLKYLNKL